MHDQEMRSILTAMDGQITALGLDAKSEGAQTALTALRASREQLELLTIGPPRQLRACPTCGKECMLEATRCGHCWAKLMPPSP
jgi:hypothetical protein